MLKPLLYRFVLSFCLVVGATYAGLFAAACGGSEVQLEDNSCTESGDSITSGDIVADYSGSPCRAPAITILGAETGELNQLTLDCTSRGTPNTATDYVTISCGDAETDYGCVSSVNVRVAEDGSETTLFTQIIVDCTVDGAGSGTIADEELIVG